MTATLTRLLPLLLLSSTVFSLPSGHGKELGLHNDLGVPAIEEDFAHITPQQFYLKYVATRTPVILRGLSKTFPAYELWTDDYIKVNKKCFFDLKHIYYQTQIVCII